MKYLRIAAIALVMIGFYSTISSASAAEPDLDIKIGQMIMVGFRDLVVTDDHAVVRDILERHIGGVILSPEEGRHPPSRTQDVFVDVTGQWRPIELEPFRSLIRQGKADLIMTAHIFNGNLEPAWPKTLSAKTITDFLRREIGFEGVVISDDLKMKAIVVHYGLLPVCHPQTSSQTKSARLDTASDHGKVCCHADGRCSSFCCG